MSPSEQEMERLSARLAALKKEVNNVIRDCENDAPINIRSDIYSASYIKTLYLI